MDAHVTVLSITGSIGALSAGWSFLQKAADSLHARAERRQAQLRSLLAEQKEHQRTFDEVFDYASTLDGHLRVDPRQLRFLPEEVATRSRTDSAFEHLRNVHKAVCLGLIAKSDLGPWVYWIHRVDGRAALGEYARACGYGSFMSPLIDWTKGSPELTALREHCPWWSVQPAEPRQARASSG
ncbi:MAG TPA: hypothetical protein VF997_19675 [Polyangia bacterium]